MTTPSRAQLAAALLSHDEGNERGAGAEVGNSAVLQPWRYLLEVGEPVGEADAGDAAEESSGGGFGMREGNEGARVSFGLSTGAAEAGSFPSFAANRPSSFRTSSLDFTSLPPPPLSRLDLSQEEEERLADEWGLSEAMSNAASESEDALQVGGGTGLARFPSTTRSEAGILTAPLAARGEAAEEEDVEVLETKSMPDLDRPRTISFAEAVLEGLEQRMRNDPPARASSTTSNDDAGSTGTRIKILERTTTQRVRARTTSLGPHAGMASLPSLSNLAGDGSVGDISSGRAGLATRDSLFQRPSSVYTTRASSIDALDSASAAARPSTDGLSLVPSRLSFASASADGPPPRPSTSLSTYTSRFDPLVIAAQRAQLAKDRPKFVREEAGRPPRVVVMPAPLAGRAASPPGRKEWREGPDSDDDDEEGEGGSGEGEEEVEEEEVPEGLKESLHPAGALYGRSLMDVIAERKAILKAQQRAYVPGSDGRKSMFEWKDSPAGKEVLERRQDEEEKLPLALVPGGQAALNAAAAKNHARAAKVKSIFGPDLVYQRELAQMRALEEVERAEREERERIAEERREEARRRKGKLRKGGRRRKDEEQAVRQEVSRVKEAVEWQPETDIAVEEPVEFAAPASPVYDLPPVESPSHRRTLAPSISVPFGASQAAGASDWFEEVLAHPSVTKDACDADSDDHDEDLYKPRPVSSLASYRRPSSAAAFDTRRNTFLSDSSASDAELEDLDELASPVDPVPPNTYGDTRHLPFPGEPSSNGHDSVLLDETQDDVPLGVRYSRQSLTLPAIKPTGLDDLSRLIPQEQLQEGAEEGPDEDDAPLGARFSRMMPPTDDGDDIPLVLRRIALAPSAAFAPRPPLQPFASIRPIGDDGKTVASDDSDDLPLGLKSAATAPFAQQPAPYSFPHTMPYSAPGAPFPYSTSQFFPPPLAPTFAPTVAPPLPPNSHAQLALAQMQMQAAMQQQAVLAEGGSIERWRREISG